MLPYQILACTIPGKIKKVIQNNKFKTWASMWNEKFELPDESYSVSNIQHYFEYIIKKHETLTDNPPIRIYVNKIENRITFKIKIRYYLQLLTPEMMKLSGRIEKKIAKHKKGWKHSSFRNYWSSISPSKCCQQWLSIEFKSLVYICS